MSDYIIRLRSRHGPVVKWYYTAFALPSQGFDSPRVHSRWAYSPALSLCAISSVVERPVHIGKAAGSIPASRISNIAPIF